MLYTNEATLGTLLETIIVKKIDQNLSTNI